MRFASLTCNQCAVFAIAATIVSALGLALADAPAAPKMSTVASADFLTATMQDYLKQLGEIVASETEYKENKDGLAEKANAIVALAQVIGNHDGESPFKGPAAYMMSAAAGLSRAADYAAAKAGVEALNAAAGKKEAGPTPPWAKVARLGMLMEEVQNVNNSLRRNLRRFDRTKEAGARQAAALAAFAQAAMYDTHEVKNPADTAKWYSMMTEMRDAATELTAKYTSNDAAGAKTSLARLDKSCATCHAVFHNE